MFIILLLIAGFLVYLISLKFNFLHKISILINIFIIILIISFGNFLAEVNYQAPNEFFKNIRAEKDVKVYGNINDINLIRKDRLEFYVISDSIASASFKTNQKIKLLCRIFDETNSLRKIYNSINPGNTVEFKGYYQKGKERRNPGEFDYHKYLQSQNITGIVSINSVSDIKIISEESEFFSSTLFHIKKNINERIYELHNTATASLLRGLLLADRHEMDYDLKTQFINAGVVHVLAVSGFNVGLIVLIFIFMFGRFSIPVNAALTITGLIAFLLITGIQASVFRATVMAIVLIIAFLSNRSTNVINSMAIAAFIILLIKPYELYSPGFQLSFAAVLSIAVIYPLLDKWINNFNIKNNSMKKLLLFTSVSLSAQIGTLPLTIFYFGKVSIIALFTNLIVIPVIGFNISLAIATLIISSVLKSAAVYYSAANEFLTDIIFKVITYSGKLEFSHLLINQYTIIDVIIFYIFVWILIYFMPRFTYKSAKYFFSFLIILNIFVYSKIDNEELLPEGYLSVMMIDVGQGDALLVKFPGGETALIDAGNATPNFDNGEKVILPLLQYLGIDRIDYAFVSHIDLDHYGGFVSLIYNNKIGTIYKPAADTNSGKDFRFENFLKSRNIPIVYYDLQNLKISNTHLYILNEESDSRSQNFSDNNRSGILKLVHGNNSFLFAGDIEKPVEKYYAEKYRDFLDVDLLKISHHGSTTSSTDIFLNFAQPEISLISAGFNNRFGHPKREVLEKLEKINSVIYRTDLDKAVLIRSDGDKIKIINWNN
ncbi:MAG TPA: DNA internalization-related competence protein ComEC/Rec2 [Ignavibacteriaceae bacterium]|nr:DNA internalization-related competence protein ComEC/Rec2 [Ignavibacteriaceae bacterium]